MEKRNCISRKYSKKGGGSYPSIRSVRDLEYIPKKLVKTFKKPDSKSFNITELRKCVKSYRL